MKRIAHGPVAAMAIAALLLLAACGTTRTETPGTDQPGTPATTQSTTNPSTTTVPQPTTSAPTSTLAGPTTTQPTTTTIGTTTTVQTNLLAEGSGCTPGPGALPDGRWFGYVLTTTGQQVEFDLACWFVGDTAIAAAKEDGEETPPNDYYVRNQNPATRTVGTTSDAQVVWYPNLGDPSSEATTTYAEWLTLIEERDFMPGVWLEVLDGFVSSIHEQWVP